MNSTPAASTQPSFQSKPEPRIQPWVWWMTAILLAGTAGVYFRLYPITVFPRDLSRNNATLMVATQMRKLVAAEFKQKKPDLPVAEAARLANVAVGHKMRETPKEFDQLVDQQARVLERKMKIETRGGYLLEVDPYYYMSQTERILRTGRIADREHVRGREFLNPMTLAPAGHWYPMDLHPFVGAWLYRVVSLLRPQVDLPAVLRWVPLLVALTALGVFAWFCRRVANITGWAGFLGLFYLMLCPMFLKRSLVGWYDTDPYNILFPLTAIAGIFLALGPTPTTRSRWIGACIAGTAFALHGLFWRGWLIPFLVIFLFLLAGLAVPRSRRPVNLTAVLHGALLIPIAVIPFAVLAIVWGPIGVQQEIASAADFIRGFLQPDFKPWPDIFITVGELNPMSFGRLAQLLGGPAWTAVIVAGLAMRLARQIREGRAGNGGDIIPLVTLLGIVCVGLVVSVRIQRFAILAVAPLAAAIPFAWIEWRKRVISFLPLIFAPHAVHAIVRRFGIVWAAATLAAVTLLGVRAHAEIVRFYPLYNPAWDRMMAEVVKKTPEDTIVTSWWSPGHFLTSMGKRRVTFDGSSQNEPQAYWVANLFIENSERTALGILRMLDISGNASVDYLTSRGWSVADSVHLIKTLVPLSRAAARDRLMRRFSPADADGLLDLTHGKTAPPPACLFVYNHMIEQALALEFIGRWDFKKAEAFGAYLRQQPDQVDRKSLARATPENTKLMWAMSDRPTFYQSEGYQTGAAGPIFTFSNGVRLNVATHADAEIRGNATINGRPASVFWINEKNDLIETPIANPTLQISVLLIEGREAGGNTGYRAVILGRRWAGSVAMRLYYLGGKGLKFIHRIASEDSAVHRTRLGLFEVDWEGFERNLRENAAATS